MSKNKSDFLSNKKLYLGIAALFLLVGFALGVGFNYQRDFSIQFDNKINPTDVLTVIVTIILAWIVTNIFDKKKQNERSSKDIVQRRIQDLYTIVSEISIKSASGDFSITEGSSATKKINIYVQNIYNYLDKLEIDSDTELKRYIEECVNKLGDLLTLTSANPSPNPEIAVIDGKYVYNDDRKLQIENKFDKLKDYLITLELSINA